VETESYIISGPITVSVAEDGLEETDRVGENGRSVVWAEMIEDPITKGVEPGFHAVGEWCGAGNEINRLDGEAGSFEETTVMGRRGEEACSSGFRVDVERRAGGLERGANCGDVAVTAHFCDEAATWTECAMNTCEEVLVAGGPRYPVEDGVGEDSVKLITVGERGGVVLLDVEATLPSCGEHSGRGIHAGEDGTSGG